MPSLALLFHLIDVMDKARIPVPSLVKTAGMAAAWCDFLEQHARRIYELGTKADSEPARRLAERIRGGEVSGPMTAREVARKGWSGLDKHEDVSVALGLLEEKGWVYEIEVARSVGRATDDGLSRQPSSPGGGREVPYRSLNLSWPE